MTKMRVRVGVGGARRCRVADGGGRDGAHGTSRICHPGRTVHGARRGRPGMDVRGRRVSGAARRGAVADGGVADRRDLPEGVDDASLEAGIDAAFAPRDGTGGVEAILAVQGGQLVVEEYNNWDPAEPHPSWSMAKSITQAMIGILVAEGRLDVFAPAPVPEWSDPVRRAARDHPRRLAGHALVPRVAGGVLRRERCHHDAVRRRPGRPGALRGRPPPRLRTGFDLVLLDRHGDDPRQDHRRPGRLRRRGHGVGPAGAVRPARASRACPTTSMASA